MTSGCDAAVVADLRDISHGLQRASPAYTVGCAFGIGHDVRVWYGVSEGRCFDSASLTKPLFTALTVLGLLSARGDLDEPAGKLLSWLPQNSTTPTERWLLAHAPGLPAGARSGGAAPLQCGRGCLPARYDERPGPTTS